MHTTTMKSTTAVASIPTQWRLQALVALMVAVSTAAVPALCRDREFNQTQVTAVIAFGDSIVDPGNNNNLLTAIKANHPPYGKDFINHEATGRFSNGYIPTDFITQGLNVKEQLPPYLGVDHTPEDLLTGVSFASGATGYDPLTPVIVVRTTYAACNVELECIYVGLVAERDHAGAAACVLRRVQGEAGGRRGGGGDEEDHRGGALHRVRGHGRHRQHLLHDAVPERGVRHPVVRGAAAVRRGELHQEGERAGRQEDRLRGAAAHRVRAVAAHARRRAPPRLRAQAQLRGAALQREDPGVHRRRAQQGRGVPDAGGVHRHLLRPPGAGRQRGAVRLHGDHPRVLRHGDDRGDGAVRQQVRGGVRRRVQARLLRQLPPHGARLQDHRRLHLRQLPQVPALKPQLLLLLLPPAPAPAPAPACYLSLYISIYGDACRSLLLSVVFFSPLASLWYDMYDPQKHVMARVCPVNFIFLRRI